MKLSKIYEPNQHEKNIYDLWERSEAFAPKNRGGKGRYSIVMPPPNANGNLHMGHELTFVLEDVVARYQRMQGKATLLLPGADHAGFETWVVYEKELNRQGKTRFDFSREQLYKQVWDFVEMNKNNFLTQLRAVGVSCDWSRFTYTLDEKVVNSAHTTFKKMWDDDLIYRGERLVNFCTFHGTSFSDIEVIYKEIPGHLWYIKYPLTDGSGSLTVATTRPETMLGDTAVAFNPKDKRYTDFIGKTIKLPLTHREIPIITDDFVDQNFGTGVVKVTPAHDPNDYEMAVRHDLPFISVIDHEGKMTRHVPDVYRRKDVMTTRQLVVEDLEEQGFLEKTESHTHSVGHCYKCNNIIQSLLLDQWFVNMKPLATEAIKALRAGEITFYPKAKLDQSIAYLKDIRDWNISRQIAWGIPIPAFQNITDSDDWIYNEQVEHETIEINDKTYRRDPDVFDTWFSSGQWPFVTLDYPDGEDFKMFYPLDLMETGGEILYQWVCRMIMLGLYVTRKVPFKEIYVHGYVMAEDGSKMSKSIGNVVDPQPVIELYGSDALRMGIIAGRSPAVNRGYDTRKVEEARNFSNKLWNVARFIEDKVGEKFTFGSKPDPKTSVDAWILLKLQQSTREMSEFLDDYRFSEAYELIYHLLWDDFADWYIEVSKIQPNVSILAFGLETILKLTHPFAPFLTETIWQTLSGEGNDNLLITSRWPEVPDVKASDAQEFEEIKAIVEEIRFIQAGLKRNDLNLYHAGDDFLVKYGDLIKALTRLDGVTEVRDGTGLYLTSTKHRMWLDIDTKTAHDFLKKLESKRAEQGKVIQRLEARLKNKSYVDNAPGEVVDQTKQQLTEAKELLAKMITEFERFSSVPKS